MHSILHPSLQQKLRLARFFKALRPWPEHQPAPTDPGRSEAAPDLADPAVETQRLAVALALVREHLSMQLHGLQIAASDREHARRWRSSLLIQHGVALDGQLQQQLGELIGLQRLSCETALERSMIARAQRAASMEEGDAIRIVHRRILRDLPTRRQLHQRSRRTRR